MILPCLLALTLPFLCTAIQHEQEWQPLLHPDIFPDSHELFPESPSFSSLVAQSYQPTSLHEGTDQCEIYKVGFKQDLYFQYIQYKADVPTLKEFTLCYWAKYTNHSNDHPIFSYAGKLDKEILSPLHQVLKVKQTKTLAGN